MTYQRFRFLASLGQNRVRSIKNLASTRTIEARFITYNQSYPYSVSGRISVSNCFDLIIMTRTSRIIMFIMADILPFCKVVKNSMCLSYCASQKKSILFFVFLNKLFVSFIIFQTNPLFLPPILFQEPLHLSSLLFLSQLKLPCLLEKCSLLSNQRFFRNIHNHKILRSILSHIFSFFNISLILTGYNVHIKAKQARFPQCLSAGYKC